MFLLLEKFWSEDVVSCHMMEFLVDRDNLSTASSIFFICYLGSPTPSDFILYITFYGPGPRAGAGNRPGMITYSFRQGLQLFLHVQDYSSEIMEPPLYMTLRTMRTRRAPIANTCTFLAMSGGEQKFLDIMEFPTL